ncbi:MAG: TlpA family protein disulfide reductase [Gammaproteobacteria bacterium]|nr:TlpA family protein disulfide reductase [Gammaproteobacteria bacterium]
MTLFAATLLGTLIWLWLAPTGLKDSPDITLLTIDGEELSLASLQGKPLLLTFWATSCPGCIKEMPHLIELYDELSPRGLEIIGVAMNYDQPSHVLSMRKSRNIPYPVALDINGAAAQAFDNVRLTPTSFLIAPDGRIVFQKVGEMDIPRLRNNILTLLQQASVSKPEKAGES